MGVGKHGFFRIGTPYDRLLSVMPPVHFFLLENILKFWFVGDKKPVTTQPLLNALPNVEGRWDFYDMCDDNHPEENRRYCYQVIEDIEHLHQRGFVYIQSESRNDKTWLIDPCATSLLAYQHVYNENPLIVNWKNRQVRLLERK